MRPRGEFGLGGGGAAARRGGCDRGSMQYVLLDLSFVTTMDEPALEELLVVRLPHEHAVTFAACRVHSVPLARSQPASTVQIQSISVKRVVRRSPFVVTESKVLGYIFSSTTVVRVSLSSVVVVRTCQKRSDPAPRTPPPPPPPLPAPPPTGTPSPCRCTRWSVAAGEGFAGRLGACRRDRFCWDGCGDAGSPQRSQETPRDRGVLHRQFVSIGEEGEGRG